MRSSKVRLVVLGFAAATAQAVLLREGMTGFAGSELAWSAVLTVWLIGMSVGARLGVRGTFHRVAAFAPAAVVIASAVGVLLIRAAPALTGNVGETAAGWRSSWLWVSAVLPAAVAGGWGFPALARAAGSVSAGRAYALEAAGACVGGLTFTFALAPFGTAAALLVPAALCVSAAFKPVSWAAPLSIALGICLALPASSQLAQLTWAWSGHPGQLGSWAETRHQRLEASAGRPMALYSDGRLLASYPDPWRTGVQGHLLMLLARQPRRVLAVGAAADGTLETLLRHPTKRIDLVEEDPGLLRHLRRWFGPEFSEALDDPAVHTTTTDPMRCLATGGPWDLIVLLDPSPISLRLHRTRTRTFFERCAANLAPSGRLVVRTAASDTYMGGAAGRLLAVLHATLDEAFPHVAAVPGDAVLLVGGHRPVDDVLDPGVLQQRWSRRAIDDEVFSAEMLPMLVDPDRAETLRQTLAERTSRPTTARHPRAVLPAAALAEGRGQAGVAGLLLAIGDVSLSRMTPITVGVVALLMVAGLAHRRPAGEIAAAAVGFGSMSWFVLLLAAWQSTRGSVYAEIGALVAAFMGGVAAAAGLLTSRRGRAVPLWLVLLGGVVVSALVAAGVPLLWPPAIPLLLILGGAATGAAFPGVATLLEGRDPAHRVQRGAGRGFSADELGAALGAASVGLLFPLAGLAVTAGAAGVLLLTATVVSLRHR